MSQDCNLIKLKRGLSTEWADLNPVLKLGEPGYEKDTKKLKIGDGVTLWNDLPYIGSGTIDFEDVQDEVASFLKAGNNIVLDYDDPNNILTISASGLQPAGNYATLVNGLVPEDQLPSYVDDVLEFNNLASFPSPGETGKIYVALDSNKVYRWSGSTYIEISSGPSSSDDVPEGSGNLYYTKDRVNDLLQAGSNISLSYDNTNITISATGLQPSGDYAAAEHAHESSDITDFNSSVSGLLSVVNISQGSGILVSENNKDFTISADRSYIENVIEDNLNTNLIAGSGIVLTYENSSLIISSTLPEANSDNIPNTLVLRDGSGNFVAGTSTLDSLQFDTTVTDLDVAIGELKWNSDENTVSLGVSNTYAMRLGEEVHYRIVNGTSNNIQKGTPVYASGVNNLGANPKISVAPYSANGITREIRFMGLTTETILPTEAGYTTHFGYIRGVDTRGDYLSNGTTDKLWASGEPSWSAGDILYVHPTTPGKLTKIEPKHSISVAIILNVHQNQGKLFVRPSSYGHLDDNHDVAVSGVTNGQFLQYNSAIDYWVPSSSGNFTSLQVNGTEVSVSGHTHTASDITDFNTSVSGFIPIQQLNAVSGIKISSSGTSREISSNFIAGNGIAFNYNNDESLLISTITNNGIIPITNNTTTTLSIPDGYVVGSLSIYQNGVKLLDGIDYTAVDGSDIVFTSVPSSGSYIEYGTPTINNSIQNLIDASVSSVYDTIIYDLGSVSGNVNVDYAIDKQIQKLTVTGPTVTLNKGSGWPTGNISRDVVLQINCISSTTIVWNIVGSNWYNKPTSILAGGEYLILLRAMDSNIIQGHYIGNKQGSL
jgi:hypothetical protein